MTTGLWIVLALLVASVAFGGYRRVTDGRARATAPTNQSVLARLGQDAGERVTLVQFSATVCAPCEATKRVLSRVAGEDPSISHVDVNAESNLDLVRELGINRTPTTLVLDRTGTERYRILGIPRAEELQRALGAVSLGTANV